VNSIAGRIIGIAVCGVFGALAAWALVAGLALDGVAGALVAAGVGMVVATVAFIVWTTLGRRLERPK
jgi:biopolymer transport protein ExbB/TolQ